MNIRTANIALLEPGEVADDQTGDFDDDTCTLSVKNTQENIDLLNQVDATWWFENEGMEVAVIGTDEQGRKEIILHLNEHSKDPWPEGQYPTV